MYSQESESLGSNVVVEKKITNVRMTLIYCNRRSKYLDKLIWILSSRTDIVRSLINGSEVMDVYSNDKPRL